MSMSFDILNSYLKGVKMIEISYAEKLLKYNFKDKRLLETALTHSSLVNEGGAKISNERMEFLGDAILDAIVSEKIYKNNPDKDEGFMSKLRASVVSETPLYKISKKYDFDKLIRFGKGEIIEQGMNKPSILSDCFEAIVAAIYLDSDFDTVKKWVNSIITDDVYSDDSIKTFDYKSKLYEKYAGKQQITFKTISEEGPAHDRIFNIGIYIDDKLMITAKGSTKKAAEQEAAKEYLKII